MNDTFTTEQRVKLEEYLADHTLPSGLGTKESACSIAAINLAINGKLTDLIPACMSRVLGLATITLQDAMFEDMRNSARYKALLPDMAGTGRAKEEERLNVLLDWLWSTVLPQLQPLADERGFGAEWSSMCRLKTSAAARYAADAAINAAANATDAAAYANNVAAEAQAAAAHAEAKTGVAAAHAEVKTGVAASTAAHAAAHAAHAVKRSTYGNTMTTMRSRFWNRVDPIGVLERMTYLKGEKE